MSTTGPRATDRGQLSRRRPGPRRTTRIEDKRMADRLRVAVVGTGSWAQRAHIPGWLRDPRVEVVALADINAGALADAASQFTVPNATTDYRELLDDPGI